jgi:hypothetical protein
VEEEGIAAKSALAKQKTKRNVRFLITEGGDVVPESVKFDHISNSSNARCKANEAMEGLLAGNQRFRKVSHLLFTSEGSEIRHCACLTATRLSLSC